MKFIRLSLYLVCLLLMGCSQSDPKPRNEKLVAVNRVSKQCAQTLSKRYGMVQSGQGGKMMYEIEGLFLAFDIYHSLSKKEARAILIDCAHEVIITVNHDPEIQKYLLPGGFNQKSVQVKIFINPDHKQNYYPDLGVCSYDFGKIAYKTNDPDNKYVYKTNETETYEEATALLENSNTYDRIEQL